LVCLSTAGSTSARSMSSCGLACCRVSVHRHSGLSAGVQCEHICALHGFNRRHPSLLAEPEQCAPALMQNCALDATHAQSQRRMSSARSDVCMAPRATCNLPRKLDAKYQTHDNRRRACRALPDALRPTGSIRAQVSCARCPRHGHARLVRVPACTHGRARVFAHAKSRMQSAGTPVPCFKPA